MIKSFLNTAEWKYLEPGCKGLSCCTTEKGIRPWEPFLWLGRELNWILCFRMRTPKLPSDCFAAGMFFFPCLSLSLCTFLFLFSQRGTEEWHEVIRKQNPCLNLHARWYLHMSLLGSPRIWWLCQLLSHPLTAHLTHHTGLPWCSVAWELCCTGHGLTTSPLVSLPVSSQFVSWG